MRALFWNFKYVHLDESIEWAQPVRWVACALHSYGWKLAKHPAVMCKFDAEETEDIASADLMIYTHTNAREVQGFNGPQWFLKSTGPGQFYTTLDTLGYGPYSSIAYERPPFDDPRRVKPEAVRAFFEEKVPLWISTRTSKWGRSVFGEAEIAEDDYVLVICQTLRDATVDGMYFGEYVSSLDRVLHILPKVTDRPIVVKLHPWTDGISGNNFEGQPEPPRSNKLSLELKQRFEEIDPRIHVYHGMGSVHEFLPRARCVLLCNSGAGIEAMLHKKPIISWGFPEYHWVTYDLRHICDMARALDLGWYDEEAASKFIYWYAEHYAFFNQESADRRVYQLLREIKPQ